MKNTITTICLLLISTIYSYSQNLIDSSTWTVGNSIHQQGDFGVSGSDALNEIVDTSNPFGESTPAWSVTPNGPSTYPGYYMSNISVDYNSSYRFTVWVKQLNSLNSNYFLKVNSGISDGLIKPDGSTTKDNYLTTWKLPSVDKWYLVVGYIKGNNSSENFSDSGVYENNTFSKTSLDYEVYTFNNTTTNIVFSNQIYLSSDANDQVLFYAPRMEKVTNDIPTINDLLQNNNPGSATSLWSQSGTNINYIDGNVGIGTTSPTGLLEIKQKEDSNSDSALIISEPNNTQQIKLHLAGNAQGDYGYLSLGGSTAIRGNNQPSYFEGVVGIGTTAPDAKLAVNGNIHAKEVKVDLIGWPDYVFNENYELPTLEEVQKNITEKGHLINIPSAQEVEENGLKLGEMDKLLLEKIEELTLYILKQEKKLEKQEQKGEYLEKQNIKLESRLARIEILLSTEKE